MPANAETLSRTWSESWTPPDNRPIYEWAAQEVDLPNCYAVTGQFEIDRVPFGRELLDSLKDPLVRTTAAQSGVQCLKTLFGELWWLHTIVENPGPSQWLQNTDEEAKEHGEERFNQLIEACPIVHRFFSENRHDKKTTAIIFKHMFLRMEGAENIKNLQRKSIKNQMCSEVWQWPKARLSEAEARLTQFTFNSKRYIESQAGVAGDDMDEAYLSGSQKVWSFRCVDCGHVQPWAWTHFREDGTRAGMRWEDSPKTRHENGEWRLGELLPTIRMECIACGFGHTDDPRTRRLLNTRGLYVPMNPNAPSEIQSFTWNQLTVENLSWFNIVKRFLHAREKFKKGNEVPQREFFQKVIAQPYDPSKFNTLSKPQTCEINSAFPEEAYRWMTVDVQEDGFWVLVMAWSKTGESRVFWCGFVKLWQDVADKQAEFKVGDLCVFVDCSWNTREVYEQCVLHGHFEVIEGREAWVCWRGLNGDERRTFKFTKDDGQKVDLFFSWPPSYGDPASGKAMRGLLCEYYHWSNPSIKDIVAKIRDGRGAKCLVPNDFSEVWTAHMYSERRAKFTDKYGHETWKWEKIGKRPNHLWDCFCMQIALACMAGIFGDAVATTA